MLPRLNVKQLLALTFYANPYETRAAKPPATATTRSLVRKGLLVQTVALGTSATVEGKRVLEEYGGGPYVWAKYGPPIMKIEITRDAGPLESIEYSDERDRFRSSVEAIDIELRAMSIAALVAEDEYGTLKVSDVFKGDEWAGWVIHQYDSQRGDLEPGELAGYLARQIVEHEDNHVEPPTDHRDLMLDVLKTVIGAERLEIVALATHRDSRDPIKLLRRAIDEHLVKLGYGADVQRMQSPGRKS